MPPGLTIRDSLSLPMMARVMSQQLCNADDQQICRLVLEAGLDLVRRWSPSGAGIRQLFHELHLNLQDAAQTANDPVQSANAARALKLVESAMWDLDRLPRVV